MNSTDRRLLPRVETELQVSNFTFNLYMLYIISFFLHLSARIPAIEVFRPDLLIAIGLLVMVFMQQQKLAGRLNNPCNRYLSIFLAYIIISIPFVEWPGSVLRGNLVEFIKASLFFYFTVLIIDSDLRLKRFVFVYMFCQLFRVLEPLYLHEAFGYWGSKTYLGGGEFAARLGGAPYDVINPNGLGLVIATIFPFLHYMWGNSRWILKLAYILLVPPLLYALVLTMSRSALIALLVIVGSIFLRSRHKVFLIIVSIFIAVMAWTNMNDIQRDRYLSLTGAEDTIGAATVNGRVNGIYKEFNIAIQRPIVGYGLGTSKEAISNVIGGNNVSHDLYLETFMETGILGLTIILLFIKSIYQTLRQTAHNISAFGAQGIKQNNKQVPFSINNHFTYQRNLFMALNACFWMYIIFSIAQYGLREYHWYLLAGLTTVLNRRSLGNLSPTDKSLT